MIEISTYEKNDMDAVIELVLHCQNDGTRPLVTVYDQPELLDVECHYLSSGGNFWVAKENGKVAGTIALMNKGNGIGILKKFFVYEQFRGRPHNLGQSLYAVFMDYAREHGFRTIFLDTPKNTERAHRFYEKAGFRRIEQHEIPLEWTISYDDNIDFFVLDL